MNKLLCVLASMLIWSGTCLAQNDDGQAVDDICSSRFVSLPAQEQVFAMRGAINEAIATLDNARLLLPTPILASGTATYIDVEPNFIEHGETVCVLGYFSFAHSDQVSTLPLIVDHIEVQPGQPGDAASTLVYFVVPKIEEFANSRDLHRSWKFWEREQAVQLRFAAFAYKNGKRGPAKFGHDLNLKVSSKPSSILATFLFAIACYVTAAMAVPAVYRRGDKLRPMHPNQARRLLPWHITGSSGQASLSQLQMLVFTLIVASLLFYQWLRTGMLQELSVDLLYLIGLSTAGAAGTQITSSIRKELDPAVYRYVQELGWFTAPALSNNRRASAADLLMSNKRFDIYKFQMLIFSFVIAAYVIVSGVDQLAHIQISATLLTLMGISQGAYIGGRATGESLAPLQDQLRGMQNLQERYEASTDPLVSAELRRRYQLAAAQTGILFSTIFERALPDYLLDMPASVIKPAPAVAGGRLSLPETQAA
ncbi:hypothetical protein [Massilia sp. erpn]|uniref:hypothetical protein n=1 Tax=Massilia sp. erpn TaxID=2738142 RepID=UPI00210431CF|nr:hypothetical protein [Massilia sp. erpn]UTY59726.1 hypothetical protein HPQ68_22640 [Massilia sp. erpn]